MELLKRKDYQPIVDTRELEVKSIKRCIEFQNKDSDKKNILAFSGGKDSVVAYFILKKSGIDFTPIYSPTSADPPELIYFIRKNFPDVIFNKYNKWTKGDKSGKEKTMWTLIGNRAILPTRLNRYCCDELKERTGDKGDTVFTGVRWEESKARADQKMVNFYKEKIMVRPIVDWSETEVWSYILQNNLPYCELYDKGFNRIGCIGCPLGTNQKRELELYPKYKDNYLRALKKFLEYRERKGLETTWKTPEEVMKWWLGESKKQREEIEGQCSMF